MQKMITILFFCFILSQTSGQTQSKIPAYLQTSFTKTQYDRTLGNNPWGMGLGIQAFFNNKTRFRPTLEFTGDLYLEDDKVLRLTSDGKAIPSIKGVINLFAGGTVELTRFMFLSFSFGPSFINGGTLLGIKPALGFYFPKYRRWMGKVSFIKVYNRENEDFGSISFSIGVRLF